MGALHSGLGISCSGARLGSYYCVQQQHPQHSHQSQEQVSVLVAPRQALQQRLTQNEHDSQQNQVQSNQHSGSETFPGPAANAEEMESSSTLRSNSDACHKLGRDPDEVALALQVVSLGSSCATKISLRRLGLGDATMPFDWMRTRACALIHWVRHDFEGFFRMQERTEIIVQNKSLTVFRSAMHSFWHSDLDDISTREQLWRRVARFLNLVADPSGRAILFVRGVAGTAELSETEGLFESLKWRFGSGGRKVFLLVIIEDQGLMGPILHSKYPEIFIWVQPLFKGQLSLDPDTPAPYEDAICFAVQRVMGDPRGLCCQDGGQWPEVSEAAAVLAPGGPLQQAGLKSTEYGLFVGDVLVKGAVAEIFFGAFVGDDRPKGGLPVPQVQSRHACMAPTLGQRMIAPLAK